MENENQSQQPQGGSSGTPSPQMQRWNEAVKKSEEAGEAGVLDTSDEGGYEPITEGAPERGVFTIVGGYVDEEGGVHSEVALRSRGGHEEDLLGNDSVPIVQRMNGILASCVTRIGTITDRGEISKAVNKLPSGSRTHLLICLRRTTHWRRTKDIYEMSVRCPARNCRKENEYKIDLSDLELFHAEDPSKMEHDLHLVDAGIDIQWKVATGMEDQALTVIGDLNESEAEILSYMIVVRLKTWNGEDVRLGISDLLNNEHKKLKLSKKAKDLLLRVKNLSSGDREDLREQFLMHEPGIDTELEMTCKHCKLEFKSNLDVSQNTFFFPSATSRRSKRRSST